MVARELTGGKKNVQWLLNGYGFSFWGDEMFWNKIEVMVVYNIVNILIATELDALKCLKW